MARVSYFASVLGAVVLSAAALSASDQPSPHSPSVLAAEIASDPILFRKHFGALDGRYSNVVAVMKRNPNGSEEQLCSGILIEHDWVLTVAECVLGQHGSDISIALGGIDIARIQRSRVAQVVLYDNQSLRRSEPALLRLERPVEFKPLRVSDFSETVETPGQFYRFGIVGWGRVPVAPSALRNEQKSFTVRTLPVGMCFPDAAPAKLAELSTRYICASSQHYDLVPCDGFRGAPLISFSGPKAPPPVVQEFPVAQSSSGLPIASGLSVGARCDAMDAGKEPVAVFLKVWPYRNWIRAAVLHGLNEGRDRFPRTPLGEELSVARGKSQPSTPPLLEDVGELPPPPPVSRDDVVSTAWENEFPFMAAIGLLSGDAADDATPHQRRHRCSGVVVSRRWVLTAAHCVAEFKHHPTLLYARVGSMDVRTKLSDAVKQLRVAQIVIHPEFLQSAHGHFMNDLALLRLEELVPRNVCAERLRSFDEMDKLLRRRPHGYMAGWASHETHASGNTRLEYVKVNLYYPSAACVQKANNDFKDLVRDRTVICAGDEKGDALTGDSGGPLMIVDEGPYRVVGIVSWGRESRDPNLPGVYTFLGTPEYRHWIAQQIAQDIDAADFCQ